MGAIDDWTGPTLEAVALKHRVIDSLIDHLSEEDRALFHQNPKQTRAAAECVIGLAPSYSCSIGGITFDMDEIITAVVERLTGKSTP